MLDVTLSVIAIIAAGVTLDFFIPGYQTTLEDKSTLALSTQLTTVSEGLQAENPS